MVTTGSYEKNIQQHNSSCFGINNIRSGDKVTNLIKAKKGEKQITAVDLTTGDCYEGYNGLDGYVGGLVKKAFKAQFKYTNFKVGANVPVGEYEMDGVDIPDNHLLGNLFAVVTTAFVGSGASLAFSVAGEAANFLLADTAIATFSGGAIVPLIPTHDTSTWLTVANGGGKVVLEVVDQVITAGDILVFGDMYNLNLSN